MILFSALLLPGPVQAGFFDEFFGGPPRPFYGNPPEEEPVWGPAPIRQHRHRERRLTDEKPVLQMPTDLMHDPTLRYGDAVMMTSGINIFTGTEERSHDREDFTPLREAKHIKPAERTILSSMDVNSINEAGAAGRLVSGRSSAVTSSIVRGVMIRDERGKPVRYVGP